MEFTVESMTCGHCVATLTRAVQALDPAARLEADLASRVVRVHSTRGPAEIRSVLEGAGYEARPRVAGEQAAATGCCGSCRD